MLLREAQLHTHHPPFVERFFCFSDGHQAALPDRAGEISVSSMIRTSQHGFDDLNWSLLCGFGVFPVCEAYRTI
jgi:hypothetical protein